jgi:hypothetical protein
MPRKPTKERREDVVRLQFSAWCNSHAALGRLQELLNAGKQSRPPHTLNQLAFGEIDKMIFLTSKPLENTVGRNENLPLA